MDNSEIKKYIVNEDLTIVESMQLLDKNGMGILFVVDSNNVLIASLTDGDIRRWLIKTGVLDSKINPVIHYSPKSLNINDKKLALNYMSENGLRALPLIDDGGHIIDIVLNRYKNKDEKNKLTALNNIPVIIMAGGTGSRLYPYTKILPKPLIPIGDIPILERIIDNLTNAGAQDFYITVNYKKEIIKAYFKELKPECNIIFVEEDEPLGTAGSISLIDRKFSTPVIVTNCDILIDIDFDNVLKYHRDLHNAMTIVSSLKNTTIPYGVLHSEKDGRIISMEEKPQMSYFINTGMYIVEPECLNEIPKNEFFHMTSLADKLMEEDKRVGMYPISENSFLDMGQFAEMKKMEEWIIENRR